MENFVKYIESAKLDKSPYQYDGVKWCLDHELKGTKNGGILADEMGLGKTITMIGLFVANILDKTLIVLPPILIQQWYDQILRTTRHEALIYHGANKKRVSLDELSNARIVLTSYDAISYKDEAINDIHRVEWSRIVFDEAHHLRNKKTSRHQGALRLKAGIKWMVTGTPIQNRRKDLVSLCNIVGIQDVDDLRMVSQRYILKRTKKDVGIIIPDIVPSMNPVLWGDELENQVSEDIHSQLELCTRRNGGKSYLPHDGYGRMRKLMLMTKAKQACAYPKMLNKYLEEEDRIDVSSKLDSVISKILENKDNGAGKLIFCNYKAEIDEIRSRLIDGGMAKVVILDGRTIKKERVSILTEKNDAIILQIQTGCEGLNLQEFYSEVYFVSPHWNPAIEDQAIGRCHRIGQKKNVMVHRFKMGKLLGEEASSMDNYITGIQDRKRDLTNL